MAVNLRIPFLIWILPPREGIFDHLCYGFRTVKKLLYLVMPLKSGLCNLHIEDNFPDSHSMNGPLWKVSEAQLQNVETRNTAGNIALWVEIVEPILAFMAKTSVCDGYSLNCGTACGFSQPTRTRRVRVCSTELLRRKLEILKKHW